MTFLMVKKTIKKTSIRKTTIESNAKALADLLKKKERLETNLRKLNTEITEQQGKLNDQFDKLGLDTNFS